MLRTGFLIAFSLVLLLPAHAHAQVCLGATEVYTIDFEAGAGGWVQAGTHGAWNLTNVRAHSGNVSVHSPAADSIAEESLFSAEVTVPPGPTRLRFWQWQGIEKQVDPTYSCYDGAAIEISTQGGGETYQRLENEILTLPYDGLINPGFGNALGDQRGWCGDPRDWAETLVDLTAFSGNDVFLRFLLSTDQSVSREGWYVDDVTIETCDPAADALVAYYPFDGITGDYSGRDHDGTLEGGAGFASGRYGDALDLDTPEAAWVDLSAGLLDGEVGCSVALWLNYGVLNPAEFGDFLAIFAHDEFLSGDLHVNLRLDSDPPLIEAHIDGTERIFVQGPVAPTGWFHYAMTYDSVAMESRVYIDSKLATVLPQPSGQLCGHGDASQIGAWDFDAAGSQDRFFKGLIDDVRIYNKALSAAEVLQLAPNLFADGFESGDSSAWDLVSP